jgi:hypothetical protein
VRRLGLLLAFPAVLAGCGNANVVSPSDVAQNYVSAIAEGNFSGACALFEAHTRDRLVALSGSSCPRLFARCLPRESTSLPRDQVQLLYANVDLRVSGAHAEARLSGTAVTKATKEVTLVDQHTHWRLTSPGGAITRCVGRLSRDRRRAHRRHRTHG